MGFGDTVNSLGNSLEGAVESAKRNVGEAVDRTADKAADGLSRLGADSLAEGVRDFGEGVSNRLGGDVRERQLGESDDPKELLHGSPEAIESRAKHLRDFQRAFENVGQGMKSLDASTWQGRAADSFRDKFDVQPKEWLKASDACEEAARALDAYADTVRWAQGQAQTAIDTWNRAQQASKQAADAHNAKVDAYNKAADTYNREAQAGKDPGPKPTEPGRFTDPGTAGREEAEALLAEAR
ncbi:type IV secretion protein Rhs, partial [Streptomyces sp. DJ]